MKIFTDLKKVHDKLSGQEYQEFLDKVYAGDTGPDSVQFMGTEDELQQWFDMVKKNLCTNCHKSLAQGNGLCAVCDSIRADAEHDQKAKGE